MTSNKNQDKPPSLRPRRRRLRLDDDGEGTAASMTEINHKKTQRKVPVWNEEGDIAATTTTTTTTTARRGCHPPTTKSCLSTSARTCSTSSSTTITWSEAIDEISIGSATEIMIPPLLITSTTSSNEYYSDHEERVVVDNLGRLFGDDCDDGNDEKCWWATATSTDALLSAADPSIPSREEWKQIADGSNGGIIEDLLDVVEGMQEVDLDQEEESETSEKVHHDEEGSSSMFLSSLVSSLIPTCRTAATQDRTSTIQSQEVNACQDPGRTTSSTSSSSCWRLSLLSSSSPPAPPPLAFQIASIPVERYDDEGLAAEEEDNVEYSMDNNSEGDEATHSSEEELVTSMKKLERILLLLPPPTQRGVVGRHEENSMIPSVCQITIDTTTITRDEKEASNTTVDKVVSSSPNNVVVVVVDVTREEWKTFGEERGILRDLILLLSF